jgi:uncharacterized protein (DUF2267 family)
MASNLQAAQSGDRREALVALRDTLAVMLDQTEAQIHAQLAAQYRATLAEIAEIDSAAAGKPKGVRDELKAKRDGRQGGRSAAHASGNA